MPHEKIYVYETETDGIVLRDSVRANRNGEFQLRIPLADETFLLLKTSGTNPVRLLVKPGENLNITADVANLVETCELTGSEGSLLIMEAEKALYQLSLSVNKLIQEQQAGRHTEFGADSLFRGLMQQHRTFLEGYINQNMLSLAAITAIYQSLGQLIFFNIEKDLPIYEALAGKLMATYPNNKHSRAFYANVTAFATEKRWHELIESRAGIGKMAIDIRLPGTDSTELRLSDLRDRTVLLKFWTPSCEQCRNENHELQAIYDAYNVQGFEIFAVSIGTDRYEWLYVLNEDQTDIWHNVKILEEGINVPNMTSYFVAQYGVTHVPYSFLINKDGRIIAKGFTISELTQMLKEIFSEP